jgi:hypothetical protein
MTTFLLTIWLAQDCGKGIIVKVFDHHIFRDLFEPYLRRFYIMQILYGVSSPDVFQQRTNGSEAMVPC